MWASIVDLRIASSAAAAAVEQCPFSHYEQNPALRLSLIRMNNLFHQMPIHTREKKKSIN